MLMKWGPDQRQLEPARVLFLRTPQAKQRLAPALSPQNLDKTMKAPVTAILHYDTTFYEKLPKLFPHNPDARNWFANSEALAEITAFRNSTLQGAYFILAARIAGLDCGPCPASTMPKWMRSFFPPGRSCAGPTQIQFPVQSGLWRRHEVFPRSPRLDFDEACRCF